MVTKQRKVDLLVLHCLSCNYSCEENFHGTKMSDDSWFMSEKSSWTIQYSEDTKHMSENINLSLHQVEMNINLVNEKIRSKNYSQILYYNCMLSCLNTLIESEKQQARPQWLYTENKVI